MDFAEMTPDELITWGRQPLDPTGSLAALLVVKGILTLEDAANVSQRRTEELVNEAQAWALGGGV